MTSGSEWVSAVAARVAPNLGPSCGPQSRKGDAVVVDAVVVVR